MRSNGRDAGESLLNDLNGDEGHKQKRLKDVSRLWQYRNGGKPRN